ncbi:MAG: phosphate ABC transporter permease PstA [bacterium]
MNINHNIIEKIVKICLWIFTIFTIFILFYIIGFVLKNGIGGLSKEFFTEFPKNMGREGGIFPIIIGTILLTFAAVFIAGPLGIGTAVYLTEYTRENRGTQIIRFGADCLAGIPSIVFGLFGFVLFVIKLKMGWSIVSGGLTLAIMILPTIIRTSEEAIKAVPMSLREVSYSLGGTKWQTIISVVIPQAIPGILTGIILSIGRCVGETAAVIFTAGSSLRLPNSMFDSVRTMSVHFYILSREGISLKNAYATASVLIISIGLINFLSYWIMRRFIRRIEGK